MRRFPLLELLRGSPKVVMAIDLQVQNLQTETIGLQNAEKDLENAMALNKLTDITSWVQKQENLYSGYYKELWQIKNAISAYERIKDMIDKEAQIASQYKTMTATMSADKHFTAQELTSMSSILNGIFTQSVNNVGQITIVINAFITQMADADRLRIIDEAGNRIDKNYADLQDFYMRNMLLSMERAQDSNDAAATMALYGLE